MQRAILALVLFAVCAQAQMFQQTYDIRNLVTFNPTTGFTVSALTQSAIAREGLQGIRFAPTYVQSFRPARGSILVSNPITSTVFGANTYQTTFTAASQYVVVVAVPEMVDNWTGNTTYTEGDIVLVNWGGTPTATSLCGARQTIVLNSRSAFGTDQAAQTFCIVPVNTPQSAVVAKVTFNKAGTEAAPLFERFNNVRRQPTIFGPVVFENFLTA